MNSRQRNLAQGIILFALYLLAGWIGLRVRTLSGVSALIWLPSGVGLASLTLLGAGLWPWIFAGGATVGLISGKPVLVSIFFGLAAAVESYIGVFLIKKFALPRLTLTRVNEVISFAFVAIGLSTFISSSTEISSLLLFAKIPLNVVEETWRTWWISKAMGSLIVSSTAICFCNDIRFRLKIHAKRIWEGLILFAVITGTCISLYTPLAEYNHSVIVRPYLLFSIMIWACIRFDVLGAITTLLIMSSTMVYGALHGFVALSTVGLQDKMIIQQLFAIALGTTGLVLASAIREREDAVEARSEFLSIASHELKTPITSLSLQLQITQKKLQSKPELNSNDRDQLMFLAKTQNQMNRLIQIINQLLDVSQIDRRQVVLHFEEVNLSELIQKFLDRIANDLNKAHCTIQSKIEDGIICQWDPLRFEQVLDNLFSNAMKYAPGTPIEVSVRSNGDSVNIEIQDRGQGIPADKVSQIFNRFFRTDNQSQIPGLGLGLFITKQIIEAHEGIVSVSSQLGHGTKFDVTIPKDAKAAADQ